MSLVGIKKSGIRSVILCQDRDFKRKVITFLNSAAFSGEKFQTETLKETLDLIAKDPMIRNVVIDSRVFSDQELDLTLQQIGVVLQPTNVKVLCYLQDMQTSLEAKHRESLPMLHFAYHPMSLGDFNNSFAPKKDNEKLVGAGSRSQSNQEASNKNPPLSLIEASLHIKDTIDLLNQLGKNRGNHEALQTIGQKFNGLAGGFAFLSNQASYKALSNLASIIDEVCRHYKGKDEQILETHWQLLKDAARCSYLLLKEMREANRQDQIKELVGQAEELMNQFCRLDDLQRRQKMDQDSVDALLEEELKRSG